MSERRTIPYDPNILPPEDTDLRVDGKHGNFQNITARSGFAGVTHLMVERDGKILFDKLRVDTSPAVFVVPVRVNPEGKAEFLLVNEWKDLQEKKVPNIPQGGIHEGETPKEAVIREVREETGYEPESIALIGMQIFDSAHMSDVQPFYLAMVPYSQEGRELELDETEDINRLPWMRPEEIRRLGIVDGKTTIGLALAEGVLRPELL